MNVEIQYVIRLQMIGTFQKKWLLFNPLDPRWDESKDASAWAQWHEPMSLQPNCRLNLQPFKGVYNICTYKIDTL